MKLQKLLSLTRKAVDEFQLIEEGDKLPWEFPAGKTVCLCSMPFMD